MTEMIPRTKFSDSFKYQILVRQSFRCKGVPNYMCPLSTVRDAMFDHAGYDIDHIVPLSAGGSNRVENLQALCPSCHRVKTATELMPKRKGPARTPKPDVVATLMAYCRASGTRLETLDSIRFEAFWRGWYVWQTDHRVFVKKSAAFRWIRDQNVTAPSKGRVC